MLWLLAVLAPFADPFVTLAAIAVATLVLPGLVDWAPGVAG